MLSKFTQIDKLITYGFVMIFRGMEVIWCAQIYLILDAKFGDDNLFNKLDELTTSCSFLSLRFSISNNESFANSDCIMSTLENF